LYLAYFKPSIGLFQAFTLAMHSGPVDQIEQQQGDQGEQQDKQEWSDIPQVRHDHIAKLGDLLDLRKHLLVSQAKKHCASEETQETRDQIIELAFAAPGGAGARSVTR
jgi:hypothetical protein